MNTTQKTHNEPNILLIYMHVEDNIEYICKLDYDLNLTVNGNKIGKANYPLNMEDMKSKWIKGIQLNK